jgi:hypothetical protein
VAEQMEFDIVAARERTAEFAHRAADACARKKRRSIVDANNGSHGGKCGECRAGYALREAAVFAAHPFTLFGRHCGPSCRRRSRSSVGC